MTEKAFKMKELDAPITYPVNSNKHISSGGMANRMQTNYKSYADAMKSVKYLGKEEQADLISKTTNKYSAQNNDFKDVTEGEFVNEKAIDVNGTDAENDNLTMTFSINSKQTPSSVHDTIPKSETMGFTYPRKTNLFSLGKPEQTVSICKIKDDFEECEKDKTNVKFKKRKNRKFDKTNKLDEQMILPSKSNEPVFSTGSEINSHRKDSKSIYDDSLTETNTVEKDSNEIVSDSKIIDLTTKHSTETMEPNSSRSPNKSELYDSESSYLDPVTETIIMTEKHSHKLVINLKSMETKFPCDFEHNSNGSTTKSNLHDFEENTNHSAKEPTNPDGDSSRKKKRKWRKKRKQASSKNISKDVCGNDASSAILEDITNGPKDSELHTISQQIQKFENDKLINEIDDTENWMNVLNKRQDSLIKEYMTILKLLIREKNAFLKNSIKYIKEKNIFEMFKIANTDILNFYPMDAGLDVLKSIEDFLKNKNFLAYKRNSILVHTHSEEFTRIFFDFEADNLDETCDNQYPSNNAENVSELSDEKYKETETNHSFLNFVSSSPVYVTVERALCFEYARHCIEILKEYESNNLFLKASESSRNIELIPTAIKYVSIYEFYIGAHQTVQQDIMENLCIYIAALDEKALVFQHNGFRNKRAKKQYRKYLQRFQEINELYKIIRERFVHLFHHYQYLKLFCKCFKINLLDDQVALGCESMEINNSFQIMDTINAILKRCYLHIWYLREYYVIYYSIDELVIKMIQEFHLEL